MRYLQAIAVVLMATTPVFCTTRYIAASAGTFSGGTACNGQTAVTVSTWNSANATSNALEQDVERVIRKEFMRLLSKDRFWAVVLFGLGTSCGVAMANNVYIAQTVAGSANGSSCANALAVTYFNASGNWTSGTPSGTQIGPGTTTSVWHVYWRCSIRRGRNGRPEHAYLPGQWLEAAVSLRFTLSRELCSLLLSGAGEGSRPLTRTATPIS